MTPKQGMTIVAMTACLLGCQEEPATGTAQVPPAETASSAPVSKPPPVVPRPASVAEVDRLILAGYTPHADHLHAPGVNECPMSKGTDAVM